jgi:transposase-like protein
MKTRTTVNKPKIQAVPSIATAKAESLEAAGGPGILELLKFGSQAILKRAVEEEITKYLGRESYERLTTDMASRGFRNGYRKTTIDTPIGQVTYDRPRVSGAPDFKSAYHEPHMRRPEEFADAVAEMYVTGVSTRKVKKALKAVAGDDVRLSRSTVSRITQRLRDEYATWCTRSLTDLNVVYIFFDAIRVGMRIGDTSKDCVLIAYAVLENGDFETLSVGLGNTESAGTWEDFIVDLKKRGLKDPLLCISDGNTGLCSMIDKYFETSYRQRCVKHKMENILNQIPKEKHQEVQPKLNRIFYGATSLEQAKQALRDFKREYGKVYPSAIARLEDDLDQSLMFYIFPANHWKRIRTSNRLERLNKELRRRLRVIGRHPSESGCLSLVFQICKRYQENKRAFKTNDLVQALWKRLRNEKLEMITQLTLDLKAA